MNTRRWRLSVLAAAAMVGGAGVHGGARADARATPNAPPAQIVIVSVDLELVSAQLKEREDKEKVLQSRKEEQEKHLKQVIEDLTGEEAKVKNMPDTPEKVAAAKAYREHGLRAKWEKEYNEQLLQETGGEMLREMLDKITRKVKEIARQRGYHIVVSSDEKVTAQTNDPNQVKQTVALKRFLYIDPALDITDDVVKDMNNDYALGGGKPAGASGPAPAPAPSGGSTPAKPTTTTTPPPSGTSPGTPGRKP